MWLQMRIQGHQFVDEFNKESEASEETDSLKDVSELTQSARSLSQEDTYVPGKVPLMGALIDNLNEKIQVEDAKGERLAEVQIDKSDNDEKSQNMFKLKT